MNSKPHITPIEMLSKYEYVHDAVGRRRAVETTGAAFSAGRFTLWGYNTRSELEAESGTRRKAGRVRSIGRYKKVIAGSGKRERFDSERERPPAT